MPIEALCTGCQRQLRVSDEHAGKLARCPACHAITKIPDAPEIPLAQPLDTHSGSHEVQYSDSDWLLRTPEGRTYGPISHDELNRWQAEGRITADCFVRRQTDRDWHGAQVVFPALGSPSPAAPPTARLRYTAEHRGGLILALGIFGWMMCPIFGVMAWVMGNADLREIREGRMDPSGAGMTYAGQLLGMIQAMIFIIGCVVVLFGLMIWAGVG